MPRPARATGIGSWTIIRQPKGDSEKDIMTEPGKGSGTWGAKKKKVRRIFKLIISQVSHCRKLKGIELNQKAMSVPQCCAPFYAFLRPFACAHQKRRAAKTPSLFNRRKRSQCLPVQMGPDKSSRRQKKRKKKERHKLRPAAAPC
jgi:hypothetical protein